jgi:protein-disulfide isomerase
MFVSTKRPQKPAKKSSVRLPWYRQPLLLGGTVGGVVVVGLVVLTLLFSRPGESFQVTRPVGQDFLPEMGDPTAPVTIYEYADFQCPACGIFARQYKPRIEEDYIKTGKARLVFKNFAFLGQESLWAAEAAYCAAEQGGFWAYHDKLFANQRGENRGAFSKPNLVRFARELGLKTEDFQLCLDSGRYRQKVQDERREGEAQGVNSTPSFIVNGQLVRGVDYLGLRELIERSLPR